MITDENWLAKWMYYSGYKSFNDKERSRKYAMQKVNIAIKARF